jgi:hypothetical protein
MGGRNKMNFDYGKLLTRTLQITWKHKVLWAILIFPILPSIPAIPLMFGYIFILEEGTSQFSGPILGIIGVLLFILFSIVSVALYAFSTSAVTLGVIRAENDSGSLNFMVLLKDGLQYFWRQAALFLIFQASFLLVFLVLFACVFASSMVTMGLSTLCFQPLILLLTPFMFLALGVLEAAGAAVIQDDSNTMDALKRGLDIVRQHIWKYVFITLIIYIGISIVSSLITIPLMLPFFFLIFGIESGMELSNQIPLILSIIICLFFPVMTLFSVISQTFMKTSLILTYLQLTQSATEEQVISLPETS